MNIQNKTGLISIVLPCYNGEKYLAQSIQSCIGQTYTNWELIIVDDCSTDSSPQIMKSFSAEDSRIRIIRNQTNLKLPASLNKGFEAAKGEYFTWTSDDNLFLPDALEKLLSALTGQNLDCVYSGYYLIDGEGLRLKERHPPVPEHLLYNNVVGASFLYKFSIHNTLSGYDEKKFLVEDYDFWFRMYTSGFRMGVIDKLLYEYRIHSGTLTAKKKHAVSRAIIKTLLEHRKHLYKFPGVFRRKYWLNIVRRILALFT